MTNAATDRTIASSDAVRRDAQAIVDLARRANSITHHIMHEGPGDSMWSEPIIVDAIAGARDLVARARKLIDRNLGGGWGLLGPRTDDGFPETEPASSFGLKIDPTDEYPVDLSVTCLMRADGVLSVLTRFVPEIAEDKEDRHQALWAVNGMLAAVDEAAKLVKWIDAGASTRKAA